MEGDILLPSRRPKPISDLTRPPASLDLLPRRESDLEDVHPRVSERGAADKVVLPGRAADTDIVAAHVLEHITPSAGLDKI